jgi:hypothetical protein
MAAINLSTPTIVPSAPHERLVYPRSAAGSLTAPQRKHLTITVQVDRAGGTLTTDDIVVTTSIVNVLPVTVVAGALVTTPYVPGATAQVAPGPTVFAIPQASRAGTDASITFDIDVEVVPGTLEPGATPGSLPTSADVQLEVEVGGVAGANQVVVAMTPGSGSVVGAVLERFASDPEDPQGRTAVSTGGLTCLTYQYRLPYAAHLPSTLQWGNLATFSSELHTLSEAAVAARDSGDVMTLTTQGPGTPSTAGQALLRMGNTTTDVLLPAGISVPYDTTLMPLGVVDAPDAIPVDLLPALGNPTTMGWATADIVYKLLPVTPPATAPRGGDRVPLSLTMAIDTPGAAITPPDGIPVGYGVVQGTPPFPGDYQLDVSLAPLGAGSVDGAEWRADLIERVTFSNALLAHPSLSGTIDATLTFPGGAPEGVAVTATGVPAGTFNMAMTGGDTPRIVLGSHAFDAGTTQVLALRTPVYAVLRAVLSGVPLQPAIAAAMGLGGGLTAQELEEAADLVRLAGRLDNGTPLPIGLTAALPQRTVAFGLQL